MSDLLVTYTQYGAIMLAGGNHGSCRNIATQSQHPITEAPIERQVPRYLALDWRFCNATQ